MSFDEMLSAKVAETVRDVLRSELAAAIATLGALPAGVPSYVTVQDAARLAKVHPATIRTWLRRGKLSRYGAGRHSRIRLDELERLLATGTSAVDERTPEEIAESILRSH